MTKPKPLNAASIVEQAADVAIVQFDYEPTAMQMSRALTYVDSMAGRKYAEDTNLVLGVVIGWVSGAER